jgi:hypothetical protein
MSAQSTMASDKAATTELAQQAAPSTAYFERNLTAIFRPLLGDRDLVTVGDAAQFILALDPRIRSSQPWRSCAAAMLRAAETGSRLDIAMASACLERLLYQEKWLAPGCVLRRVRAEE